MSTDSQFDNVVNNTDMTEIDNQGKLHFNPRFLYVIQIQNETKIK